MPAGSADQEAEREEPGKAKEEGQTRASEESNLDQDHEESPRAAREGQQPEKKTRSRAEKRKKTKKNRSGQKMDRLNSIGRPIKNPMYKNPMYKNPMYSNSMYI